MWATLVGVGRTVVSFDYQVKPQFQDSQQTVRIDDRGYFQQINENKESTTIKTITSLHGGAFIEWIWFLIFLKFLQLGYKVPPQLAGVDGVFVNPPLSGSGSTSTQQSTSLGPSSLTIRLNSELEMQKPAGISQAEYSQIPKQIKRQLSDPLKRDRCVEVTGKPKLDLPWNQFGFKVNKHFDEIMEAAGICPDPNLTKEERTEALID